MWKKFVAIMALVGILSTSSVSADTPDIAYLNVDPSTFSAQDGENTVIYFAIDEDANVQLVITDANENNVKTFSDYDGDYYEGSKRFEEEWDGRDDNGELVEDGLYEIVLDTTNSDGSDSKKTTVEVETPGENSYPEIYGLNAYPSTFEPEEGEKTTVNFTLNEGAYITFVVKDEKGNVVKTNDDKYNGEFYFDSSEYFIVWDGTYNNGELVPAGDYVVYITTQNSAGQDMESVKVEVEKYSVTPPPLNSAPEVTGLDVSPSEFAPEDNETTKIEFNVDKDADLEVLIKKGSTLVKTFSNYNGDNYDNGDFSITWDGTSNDGDIVSEGIYTVYVTAENDNGSDTDTVTVYVNDDADEPSSDGVIEDVTLNPSNVWDPTEDELEIEFELTEEVDDLIIEAKKGSKTIEIYDDEDADADDYEETWDGTDDDGDYVSAGTWEIIITANGDSVSKTITVEYEKPEIVEAFVTKDSFDPDKDEVTNLVFKVDATSIVTVEVYDGNKRIETLMDEEEVRKNKWYAIEWDGMDDGDEVDEGEYKFKITAENEVDDDINDIEYVNVDVEEDDVSSSKANVTEDYTKPIIFDDEDGSMTIYYCLDDDAEVYLAIYDGKSASGSAEVELLDYLDQGEGCHSVKWIVEDEDGKGLKDGIYSYKIISKVGSRKDTETGRFVVGDAGDAEDDDDADDDDGDTDVDVSGTCSAYYWDLDYLATDNELCKAIAWVTEEGIFHGYPDGAFRPYQNINRAEVLKVVLEAFDVNLLPTDGSKHGFSDVQPYAWYMKYVRTAKFYNMLHGYGDGTVRLENSVNRVELLKFVLEASESFTGYEFLNAPYYNDYADVDGNNPNEVWFYEYANAAYKYQLYNTYSVNGVRYLRPGQLVERGEVALLLYRMKKADLLD